MINWDIKTNVLPDGSEAYIVVGEEVGPPVDDETEPFRTGRIIKLYAESMAHALELLQALDGTDGEIYAAS